MALLVVLALITAPVFLLVRWLMPGPHWAWQVLIALGVTFATLGAVQLKPRR